MTAAMNGAVNLSVADGWFPEFAKHGENGFVISVSESSDYLAHQDEEDHNNLFKILENEVIPTYYTRKDQWLQVVRNSMQDILPKFDSDRMVGEYFDKMY